MPERRQPLGKGGQPPRRLVGEPLDQLGRLPISKKVLGPDHPPERIIRERGEVTLDRLVQ